MKKHMGMLLLGLLVVAVLLISTVAFTVDELQDIVLVKTFGRVTEVYSGTDDAGLHLKWPWPVQRLVRYDARTFILEDPYGELTTEDQQNVLLSMYCTWRIQNPVKFHQSVETPRSAVESIRERLHNHKNNVVSRHTLAEFVNTDPQKMRIPQIEAEILEALQGEMAGEYGVEVRSVGLKLIGLPQTVSQAVIEAQKKEREQYVQQYRTAGEAQATAIRARAQRASKQILAFASAKALKIRAEGDSAAAKYYRKFARNERLAMFLRSLESLREELKSKTVILLDGSEIPAVKFFREGPSLPELPAAATGSQLEEQQRRSVSSGKGK
ncbi:MAG: protease modulator HflC [Planctomycetota bacterium]|jgi:membrane protease subunit HflC